MYPNQQNNPYQPTAPNDQQNPADGPIPNPYQMMPVNSQMPTAPSYAPSQLINGQNINEPQKKSNKKKFIIIGAGALVVVLVIIAAVVVSMSGSTKNKSSLSTDTANTKSETAPGLIPLTSVTLEQINAAIGFDFSTLNDVKDFYPEKLDDKTLGL